MRVFLVLSCLLIVTGSVLAQWQQQASGAKERLRGLHAVNSRVVWTSGNKGTFARTTDGGANWQAGIVPGAEALDFRDVHAISATTAYLLSIGAGEMSRIYKTMDGGANWTLQYKNSNEKAFFDAMAFWDERHGLAMSDPVDGRFLIITTADGGKSWQQVENIPAALPGESAFAASGTCLITQGTRNAFIATGGAAARVFRTTDRGRNWSVAETPIASGGDSAGIFSIAFKNEKVGIVVGGDYKKPDEARNNLARTTDGGHTWQAVSGTQLSGYRSCVAFLPGTTNVIAVGPNGSDYSRDNGLTWQPLATEGFHSVSFAGRAGWASGDDGKIAKFVMKR